MKALLITPNGKTKECEVSRKNLVYEFQIHTRDLRPVFIRKQVMTIMPRGKCIIVSFRSVKIVVGAEKMYVFNLENKKIKDYFIPLVIENILSIKEKIRFEHLIFETVLAYMLQKFHRRFEEIERTSNQILEKLEKDPRDHTFGQLLQLKKRLSKLGTNVEEVEKGMMELVDDDEDLKDLYLGVKNPQNTDEVESILEDAIEQIEDISHQISELNENIDDTQEILNLKMDSLRNAIIRFDLILTAATGMLAIIAVITGLYGMNLKNHMEEDPFAFWIVSVVLGLSFLLGFGLLILYLKKKKIL